MKARLLGLSCALCLMAAQAVSAQDAKLLWDTLGSLSPGTPAVSANLTVIPLVASKPRSSAGYTTLDEAMRKGWLEVTELDGGNVPRVKLTNKSDRIIYLMGGEILTGCRQDRMIGNDVIIGARARDVILPVYCVEHGRWTSTSSRFSSKQVLGTWGLRSKARAAEPSAQSKIWDEVADISQANKTDSETGAYQEIYENGKVKDRIAELESGLKDIPRSAAGIVGAACAVGGRIVSIDVFADPSLFQRMWPKILRSTALSAISEGGEGAASREGAVRFLKSLIGCKSTIVRAAGLGWELRASSLPMSALLYDGAVVHMAGYPQGIQPTVLQGGQE